MKKDIELKHEDDGKWDAIYIFYAVVLFIVSDNSSE